MAHVERCAIFDALVVGFVYEVGKVRMRRLNRERNSIASSSEDRQRLVPVVNEILSPVGGIVSFLCLIPRRCCDGIIPIQKVY